MTIDPSRPSAVDVFAGVVGRGGRAGVTIVSIGVSSIRPAVALVRDGAGATVDRLLDAVLDRVAVRLVRAGLVERLTAELIAANVPERVAEQVVEANVMEDVVEQLIASNTMDRLVETVLESRFYDDAVDRVLESDELWRIVHRISHSPEVMSAITSGSSGLAGEVADQVRRRTEVADEVAEKIMGRLLRRTPRDRRW